MSETRPILAFQGVTVESQPSYETTLVDADFSLPAGGLVLVRLPAGVTRVPLADAAQGLIEPAHGQVVFMGEDWRFASPDHAAVLRGRIGRVFEQQGLISNLDTDENVTLATRYHTNRSEESILEEAEKLARQFGFAELPRQRPSLLKRSELRRVEWVRAFLGEPTLIILEEPMVGVYPDALSSLVDAVKTARERGAAVLWICSDEASWRRVTAEATLRFELRESRLVPVEGG